MQKLGTKLCKEIKIINVVCTADLQQKIEIKKFNEFGWGIYDFKI